MKKSEVFWHFDLNIRGHFKTYPLIDHETNEFFNEMKKEESMWDMMGDGGRDEEEGKERGEGV